MTAFTDCIVTTARDLLTEFGESASFTKIVEGAYSTSDGTVAAGTTTNYSGFVVPVDYVNAEIDGEFVLQGDIKLFVEQTTTEPSVGDVVTVNSIVYRVMSAKKYRVSSVNVLYELQVRV